jgi:methylenetetrahydrofolate dehydrogenase (NADP+)/methenyltetrahydrofolate cyclohydrolase
MVLILEGKPAAEAVYDRIRQELASLPEGCKQPCLAAVIVGDIAASRLYINTKIKACEGVGFRSLLIELPESVTQEELLAQVQLLNDNPDVHGIIVQLPLPIHLSEAQITEAILPEKDVDGFHPFNIGKMCLGMRGLRPATPAGIITLLDHYQVQTEGRHCVVLGRSNIVGMPIAVLLSKNEPRGNATVTLCHSKTPDIQGFTREADILIAAVGIPEWVKADWVKEGAIVIDVGIHRISDPNLKKGYRVCGDVDFHEVAPKTSFITPVPGGVGLMTVAQLLKNTFYAYLALEHQHTGIINS